MAKFWNTKFGSALKKAGNWTLNTLDELSIPVISQVASMATGILGANWQKNTVNDRMSGAEREAFNLNAQEAQKARDWNLEMDNTKYQRQVTDMQKAGINPALAMNGGVSTQATSNAMANASAQQASIMPIQDFATLAAALKSAKADQDLKKSQADNQKEDERGKRIQNDANAITLLDQQLEQLRLTREQGNKTAEEKRKIQEEIEKIKEEKKILIQQQTLNDDQHDIYEYTKKRAAIELEYLPQQLQNQVSLGVAQIADTKAAVNLKIADYEAYDWNTAKLVSYAEARSYGANVSAKGVGVGGNYSLSDSSQGILTRDRKTGKYSFIPISSFVESAEEEKKADKKSEKSKLKKDVAQGMKDGTIKLGGAK